MRLLWIAAGAGIGYLAGNASARRKTMDAIGKVKSSPQMQAVEQRLGDKVTNIASKGDREIDLSGTSSSYGTSATPDINSTYAAEEADSGTYSSMNPR